jgi:hypothetical protein
MRVLALMYDIVSLPTPSPPLPPPIDLLQQAGTSESSSMVMTVGIGIGAAFLILAAAVYAYRRTPTAACSKRYRPPLPLIANPEKPEKSATNKIEVVSTEPHALHGNEDYEDAVSPIAYVSPRPPLGRSSTMARVARVPADLMKN